ncbi:hypothetical protein D3C85_1337610 [compost metagenome]
MSYREYPTKTNAVHISKSRLNGKCQAELVKVSADRYDESDSFKRPFKSSSRRFRIDPFKWMQEFFLARKSPGISSRSTASIRIPACLAASSTTKS